MEKRLIGLCMEKELSDKIIRIWNYLYYESQWKTDTNRLDYEVVDGLPFSCLQYLNKEVPPYWNITTKFITEYSDMNLLIYVGLLTRYKLDDVLSKDAKDIVLPEYLQNDRLNLKSLSELYYHLKDIQVDIEELSLLKSRLDLYKIEDKDLEESLEYSNTSLLIANCNINECKYLQSFNSIVLSTDHMSSSYYIGSHLDDEDLIEEVKKIMNYEKLLDGTIQEEQ